VCSSDLNDAQHANPGAREQGGQSRAGGSTSDDNDPGGGQSLLALGADAAKKYLPGVSIFETICHKRG
jgi:hypothetical protein